MLPDHAVRENTQRIVTTPTYVLVCVTPDSRGPSARGSRRERDSGNGERGIERDSGATDPNPALPRQRERERRTHTRSSAAWFSPVGLVASFSPVDASSFLPWLPWTRRGRYNYGGGGESDPRRGQGCFESGARDRPSASATHLARHTSDTAMGKKCTQPGGCPKQALFGVAGSKKREVRRDKGPAGWLLCVCVTVGTFQQRRACPAYRCRSFMWSWCEKNSGV